MTHRDISKPKVNNSCTAQGKSDLISSGSTAEVLMLSFNGLLVFILEEIILDLFQKNIDRVNYKVKKFFFFQIT